MAIVEIKYSDGFVDKQTLNAQEGQDLDTLVDEVVNNYLVEHPGVSRVSVTYLSEKDDTVKDMDEYHERRKKEIFKWETQDHEHMANKLMQLLGARFWYEYNGLDEEKIASMLKETDPALHEGVIGNLNRREIRAWLALFDIERSVLALREFGISLDTPLKDMSLEKLRNMLGHKGEFANLDEKTGMFKHVAYLRDTIVISTSNSELGAVLRGMMTKLSGRLYNNNDVLDMIVDIWMKKTGEKDDPRYPTMDEVKAILELYKKEVKNEDGEVVETINPPTLQ